MEDEIDVDRAVEDLNNALRTFSQIEWVGTLDDLIRGSHPFAERVRKEFWELEESDSTGRQNVSDEEITSFRQFLAEYGICWLVQSRGTDADRSFPSMD